MEENRDLWGTIEVPPHNSFYVKYKLYQTDNEDVSATIQPSFVDDSEKDFTIVIRRSENEDLLSTLDIKYREQSEIIATLQPVSSKFVNATIEVNPHNSMYAIADILQPPLLTKEFETVKDATVRSGLDYQTLNYGTEPSMMVGCKNSEEFEAYIDFNIQLPQNVLIQDARLKLYFVGNYTSGLNIKLYSVDREWSEYALTYRNKPQRLELISDTYTVDYTDRSINFNLKNEINEVYTNQKTSKGYVVVIEHNNSDNYISFYTKEGSKPPKLIVDYYDTQIYSAGRAQINSTMFVYGAGRKEIGATINVHSDRGNDDLISTLYVHRYDTPVPKDLPMTIAITRNSTNSKITVAQRDNKDVRAIMRVAEKRAEDLVSMLSVTRNEINSMIYVKHQKTVNATITVQKYEDENVVSMIAVNRDSINSTIFVRERSYINSTITVQKHEGSNIISTITITRENIPATIFVKERSNLTSTIAVARNIKEDLISSITVTKDHVYSTISVKEREYLDSQVTVRRTEFNEMPSMISVTKDSVNATITVKERSCVDATIFVYQVDKSELPSILAVRRDNINATLIVKAPSDINSTMIISKPEIKTGISVRVKKDDYLNTTMHVRAKDADDLISVLVVKSERGRAYYFII
jgi:hypothetical protein